MALCMTLSRKICRYPAQDNPSPVPAKLCAIAPSLSSVTTIWRNRRPGRQRARKRLEGGQNLVESCFSNAFVALCTWGNKQGLRRSTPQLLGSIRFNCWQIPAHFSETPRAEIAGPTAPRKPDQGHNPRSVRGLRSGSPPKCKGLRDTHRGRPRRPRSLAPIEVWRTQSTSFTLTMRILVVPRTRSIALMGVMT